MDPSRAARVAPAARCAEQSPPGGCPGPGGDEERGGRETRCGPASPEKPRPSNGARCGAAASERAACRALRRRERPAAVLPERAPEAAGATGGT